MSLLQLGPVIFGGTPGIIQYLRRHGLLASTMAYQGKISTIMQPKKYIG